MAGRDYYAELGVSRNASTDEIARAFRRLAAKYHPDRNPGDKQAEEKFKRIAEAYNVLQDPKARAAYDRGGREQVEVDTGFHGFDSTEDIFSRFGDVFGDLFGDRLRRSRAPARGQDYEVKLTLTSDEAARGGVRTISVELPTACELCRGTGARDGVSAACPTCQGSGYVSRRATPRGGFFSVSTPCPRCRGTGVDPAAVCPRCGGRGVEDRPRVLEVTIPPNSADGTVLRLRGAGGPGTRGGPPGDLRVRVHARKAAPPSREVGIDLATAALGGTVEVPLPGGGTAEMKIPPGTQPGQRFRLAGQALDGDLEVTVRVRVPTRLSEEERRLLEEWRSKHSPSGDRRS